ncbi:MAG: acyl transferase [Ferruginibacter sp.]
MNPSVKNTIESSNIFGVAEENFNSFALEVFHFQYENNLVYNKFCHVLKIIPEQILHFKNIPFLPIQFFKSHQVKTTEFEPEVIFESSGTTQTIQSKHLVRFTNIYEKSFNKAFNQFYGQPSDWCIIALLPVYLERKNSSLVLMADKLIQQSGHPASGFYLNDLEKLSTTLEMLEKQQTNTLLIGVTFALLDFAESFPKSLKYTTIMETGGMKGRREELTRTEVHQQLCNAFNLKNIHSEYGMTELLSQAYSTGEGIFNCPPWMKILVREEDDPFAIHSQYEHQMQSGAINIIDLANIYSCSFIATEDAGKIYSDGSFEILGRLDNADIRGCSLLSL